MNPTADMAFWVNMPRSPHWTEIMDGVAVPSKLRILNVKPKDYAWVAFCIDACWHYQLMTPTKEEALTEEQIEIWEAALDWIDDEIEKRGGDIEAICDEIEIVVATLQRAAMVN